jgi:hypothetical protein
MLVCARKSLFEERWEFDHPESRWPLLIEYARTRCVGMPEGVVYYNGGVNEPCDLIRGPCLCGAGHGLEEWHTWVLDLAERELGGDPVVERAGSPAARRRRARAMRPAGMRRHRGRFEDGR